jgi:hypothetical protein
MTKYSLSIGWQFYFPLCVTNVVPPVFKNRNQGGKQISPPKPDNKPVPVVKSALTLQRKVSLYNIYCAAFRSSLSCLSQICGGG